MYIMINIGIGEKRINLSYPICSITEVAVITMLSDNVHYEIIKPCKIINSISTGNEKWVLGKELISVFEGMTAFAHFVDDERVIKTNKLGGITEVIFNLNELDNTDNLEDGRPSNVLLTYHVTDKSFTHFEPNIPQYKKLGGFVSLSLQIMDQKNNIITGPQVTIVFYICDCKS